MKKDYKAPVVVLAEHAMASSGACGWYTQCGEQVQQRD